MLNLYFGDLEGALLSGNGLFDYALDEECITTDFGKNVIKEIEDGTVVSPYNILHPLYGSYPPQMLSGGVKSLFIIKFTDEIMDLASLGENCFKILGEICADKDVTMCTDTLRDLYRFGFIGKIHILNTDVVVDNPKDYIREYVNSDRKV